MPLGLRALALPPILTHRADNRPVLDVKGCSGLPPNASPDPPAASHYAPHRAFRPLD